MRRILSHCILLFLIIEAKAQDTLSFPVQQASFFIQAKDPKFKEGSISKGLVNKGVKSESAKILDEKFDEDAVRLANCNLTPPNGIDGLTGGFNVFDYQLSSEAALRLGVITIGEFNSSGSKEYYVYDHLWYKNSRDCANREIVYGAGVRLIVSVKRLSTELNLSGLSAIAASAEMKTAEVSVNMKTIGLSGAKIDAIGIPSAGAYNIQKHIEYLNCIDKIRSLIRDSTTTVTPEVVSINLIDDSEYIRALVMTHGIRMIIDGKNYPYALSKIPNASEFAIQTLKNIYMSLVKRIDNSPITNLEKLQTKVYLTKAGF